LREPESFMVRASERSFQVLLGVVPESKVGAANPKLRLYFPKTRSISLSVPWTMVDWLVRSNCLASSKTNRAPNLAMTMV